MTTPRKPEHASRAVNYWAFLVRTADTREWRAIRQRGRYQAEKTICHRADVLEVLQVRELTLTQYENFMANTKPRRQCRNVGCGTVVRRNGTSAPRA